MRFLILVCVLLFIVNGKDCQPKALFESTDYWEIFLQNNSPNMKDHYYLYYWGGDGDRLALVDPNGALLWTLDIQHNYLFPSPVQPDGNIYIAEISQRAIGVINAQTGKILTPIPISDPKVNITDPTAICKGVIYGLGYVGGEGYIIGVDSTSGSTVWTSSHQYMSVNQIDSMPIVSPDCSSIFYLVDNTGSLLFNRENLSGTNNVMWSISLNISRTYAILSGGWSLTLSPDFKRFVLIWVSGSFQNPTAYHLYIMDTNTGSIRYQQSDSGYQGLYSYSTPLFSSDGTSVYFAPSNIYGISLNDGTTDSLKWSLPIINGTQPWSYPHSGALSSDGNVLYYALRFDVIALNTASLEINWSSLTNWDPQPNYSFELKYVEGVKGHVVGLGLKDIWDYSNCE